MIRPVTRLTLPRTFAVLALLTGLAALSPAARAQSTAAATLNPAIFSDPSGSVVYAGNFRHYAADNTLTHGYLALSLSPMGKVTGTLIWHGTTTQLPLKGKLDVATGQGHFTQRDADGKKLADAVRIPFLVSTSGLTMSGGGLTGSGDSTTFLLTKHYDGSGSYGDAGGAVLTLGGSNSYASSGTLNVGAINYIPTLLTTNPGVVVGVNPDVYLGSGTTVYNGTLNFTATADPGNVTITGAVPTVVDGNLSCNGYLLLNGPLTMTTDATGSTVYTGTSPNGGAAMTVTVLAPALTTGG